ncbi:MAG: T9SS type A sorting domain-containing protein [Bacteroidota bacterium]
MKSGIYIPEPCHEDWDKMTPRQQGRFCAVCSKEVVDFTKKTSDDILNYLSEATGKTCGRFTVSQLDSSCQPVAAVVSRGKMRWWKKAGISFLALLGVFGLSKNAKAQKMGKVAIKGDVSFVEDHNTNKTATQLSGSVKDSENKPLAMSTIRVFSGGKQIAETTTIANGSYSLTLPAGTIFNNKITVWAYALGYEGKKVENMNVSKESIKLNFSMNEEIQMLGEIMMIEKPKDPVVEKPVINEVKKPVKDSLVAKPEVVKIPETTCEKPGTIVENKSEVIVAEMDNNVMLKIYPNPSSGEYQLEIGSHLPHHITVRDLSGKSILQKNHVLNKTKIDISSYANGIYFLVITDAKSMKIVNTQKLIKQ